MEFYVVNRIPTKRRARHTRNGHTYTDERTRADMSAVKAAYKGVKHDCAVAVVVFVYKQLPKAKKRPEPYMQKPDVDNCAKCVMDALNGVAYEDDKQVTKLYISKLERTTSPGEYIKFAVVPADKLGVLLYENEVINGIQ